MEDELYHHGVKGMKWGVRKSTYSKKSHGIRSRNNSHSSISINDVEIGKKFVKDLSPYMALGAISSGLAISGFGFASPFISLIGRAVIDDIRNDGKRKR